MTDARSPQIAAVAVTQDDAGARVPQFAAVAICSEVPPVAGGARLFQYAIVTVAKEFTIPVYFLPFGLGMFMATMPYYIGEFPEE